jgi:trimeric autotransporter adhesin
MRYSSGIVHAALYLWSLVQCRKTMQAALLLCFAGLVAGCGFSSNAISIVGPAPPTLSSISVGPANITLHVGLTRQFTATGSYSDGSTQDITASVTWSSATATVATIGNAAANYGVATAISAGSTTITATSGSLSGSTTLNVTSSTLVAIGVTPAAPSIAKGTTQQFMATGVYSDNSTQNLTSVVTWHAVNPAVASIGNAGGNAGLATALTAGTTQITATLGGVVGSTNLKVTATLVSIDVTPITATIRIGATQQYTATGHYTDLTTQDITTLVTWNSGTAATATISNAAGTNGLATGLAQGTTLVTAALGAINSNANPATLTVAAFAYAVNFLSNNVSQFLIGTDGTLTAIGAGTVAAGANPYALAVDPSSNFVYVANFLQPGTVATTISQFAIGADGSLTGIGTGSVAAAGHGPNGITVSPTGPYVYTANFGTNDVSLYSIGAGGALTFVASVAAGAGPAAIALNPAGTFAYVANFLDGDVSQYSVSAADGSLTPLGTVPAGSQSNMVVVDPSGRFVYVPNHAAGTVSQYVIGAGGALTPIAAAVASGTGAWSITIDSAGSNAYVANADANSVSHFTIDPASGALTLVNALGLPALTGPTSVAIDPSGLFAYISDRGPVASPQTTISQCSIAADGSLTLLTPPIAPAGTAPAAIITAR